MSTRRAATFAFTVTLSCVMNVGAWAAGDGAESAGIPKQFQGHWDMPGACKSDSGSPLVTKIASNEITYYEVSCVLKRMITSNTQSFSGLFDCEEGGDKFAKQLSLSIENGKLIDRNWPSESSALGRCK